MTNGIEDAAMQLLPAGSDKVKYSFVGARALELVVGKGTM